MSINRSDLIDANSNLRGRDRRVLPGRDQVLKMYRLMMKIRRFEETAEEMFRQARMRGALHFYIGEEASGVGVCSALLDSDYITSTHRGHGHCIAKGGRVDKMMAELFGRATGYCGGKGGSMHIADLDIGILGANGIVGAGIPIAAGAGLGSKLRGEDAVTVSFFGDGAGPTGAFHEGVNFAAVKKLPVVFVCENNQYGMATRSDQANAGPSIAGRGDAYGIPGVVVDGQDVIAVYEVASEAVARARAGAGPTLIESFTYRYRGHTVHDMAGYRSKEELAEWVQRDPIFRFRRELIEYAGLEEAEIASIDAEVDAEVSQSVEFAESSPFPDVSTIEEDVYAS